MRWQWINGKTVPCRDLNKERTDTYFYSILHLAVNAVVLCRAVTGMNISLRKFMWQVAEECWAECSKKWPKHDNLGEGFDVEWVAPKCKSCQIVENWKASTSSNVTYQPADSYLLSTALPIANLSSTCVLYINTVHNCVRFYVPVTIYHMTFPVMQS